MAQLNTHNRVNSYFVRHQKAVKQWTDAYEVLGDAQHKIEKPVSLGVNEALVGLTQAEAEKMRDDYLASNLDEWRHDEQLQLALKEENVELSKLNKQGVFDQVLKAQSANEDYSFIDNALAEKLRKMDANDLKEEARLKKIEEETEHRNFIGQLVKQ